VVAVKFDDISLAFDFVSSAAPMEHGAYISLETGQIYWMSEFTSSMDEEVPDDFETSDRYVAIPHKNDLNLGRDLAFRFVAEHLPGRYGDVRACFRSKGLTRSSSNCLTRRVYSTSGIALKRQRWRRQFASGVKRTALRSLNRLMSPRPNSRFREQRDSVTRASWRASTGT